MSSQKYYLCVTPFFPSPDNWRGAYIFDQVKAIQRNSNFKVVVFQPCGLFEKRESVSFNGVDVHFVPSWFMPSYLFNGFGGEINGCNLVRKLRQLDISFDNISVCHCHTAAFACFASALKRQNRAIRIVMQYHDLDPFQVKSGKFSTWKPNITYRVKKFVSHFPNIDLHLCISERVKYNLEHFPFPHPEDCFEPYLKTLEAAKHLQVPRNLRTYVLYNGVDTSLFRPRARSERECVFKIGCISNFNELKGHITLIKAVEIIVTENPNAEISVSFIGSGETLDSCRKYIASHGLEKFFVFEPEMKHERLPAYYNSLDLFVLPSYFEGFGCVYTEAAACGVPFMGCTGQGYSEYISQSDKDKWLIAPMDYRSLARLIERQIKHPCRQRLSHAYDIDELIKTYLDYLKSI